MIDVQSLFFFRWTPYSSLEFFLLLVPAFLLLALLRPLFRIESRWIAVIELANLLFLVVLFPQPIQLFLSATWFFALLKWRERQPKLGLLQGALLLLPMLIRHNAKEIEFWGLSYVTFRVFHLFIDQALIKTLTFRSFFTFAFYFPSLLAGPVDRFPRFKEALSKSWSRPVAEFWVQAFSWLALGLTQKYVFAEAVRRYWLPSHPSTVSDWISAFYSYPTYLYLDFAGYSAMALGFSLLIGVELPLNFNKPFLSSNPQDFWRRFHISLGEWLRDYFFKPLYFQSSRWPGLSPLARQNICLFLTFFLMGAWNGLHKPYLISGSLFGIYSAVHNTYVYRLKQKGQWNPPTTARLWLNRVLMLHLAALALLVFSGLPFGG